MRAKRLAWIAAAAMLAVSLLSPMAVAAEELVPAENLTENMPEENGIEETIVQETTEAVTETGSAEPTAEIAPEEPTEPITETEPAEAATEAEPEESTETEPETEPAEATTEAEPEESTETEPETEPAEATTEAEPEESTETEPVEITEPLTEEEPETEEEVPSDIRQQTQTVWMQSGNLALSKPTADELLQRFLQITEYSKMFTVEPSVVSPYAAGSLSSEFIANGLEYLNFVRYVAGLGDAIVAPDSLNEAAQYGAVVMAANDALSHYPTQPSDMPDDFYQKGAAAASSSNIACGYDDLYTAVQGWMEDNIGTSNLACLGHRRWLLNPRLLNVGFGAALSESGKCYSAIKVFDTSAPEVDYDFVSWPASGNMPSELIDTSVPWSVTVNPSKYQTNSLSSASVTIKRVSDDKTWTLNSGTGDTPSTSSPYFLVETSGYGVSNCLIFHVGSDNFGASSLSGDYQVVISGIKDINGKAAEIAYQIHFYEMTVKVQSVKVIAASDKIAVGGTNKLTVDIQPANATVKSVNWKAYPQGDSTAKLTVDTDGTVHCISGNVGDNIVIFATAKDGTGCYGYAILTIVQGAESVSLNTSSLKLTAKGETSQLTATVKPEDAVNKSVTWSSSNPSVATVSSDGLVTAVANGTTVITVTTADGGYTAECTVTVDMPVINIDKDSVSLKDNESSITVSWKSAANAQGYEIARRSNGGSVSIIQTLTNGQVSFNDTTAIPGVTYSYAVRGFYSAKNGTYVYSDWTYEKSLMKSLGMTPKVTGAYYTVNGIKLFWSGVNYSHGYEIFRYDGTAWSRVYISNGTASSWTDTTANPNTVYIYQVRAFRRLSSSQYIYSSYSSMYQATLKNFQIASIQSLSGKKIYLTYTGCDYAVGYEVFRNSGSGWQRVNIVWGTTPKYTDTNLTAGVTYQYQIRAFRRAANGQYIYSDYTPMKSARAQN